LTIAADANASAATKSPAAGRGLLQPADALAMSLSKARSIASI
jgi:hypothetical protein